MFKFMFLRWEQQRQRMISQRDTPGTHISGTQNTWTNWKLANDQTQFTYRDFQSNGFVTRTVSFQARDWLKRCSLVGALWGESTCLLRTPTGLGWDWDRISRSSALKMDCFSTPTCSTSSIWTSFGPWTLSGEWNCLRRKIKIILPLLSK